ncbi:Hypothetical predicted protein [Mytilus galloprovincialis]|uniref:Uncharacterized protein n=1 Tax=Mytilus galloprovincialis TaxID=29158 RepID=A0A8B6FWG5_MYTGA|nr:Hypothetical predicted protein [Mytilus galloprovincialis]
MGLFEGISRFVLISTILTAVGFLVHLISYGAPYWLKSGEFHVGLWKLCIGSQCYNTVSKTFKDLFVAYEGWLAAVQAFETLAFLASLATIAVIGLRFTVMKEQKILQIGIFIFQFASVGLILLGVIIFGAKSPSSSYGYAFVFEIISAIIFLIAGVFSFMDWRGTSVPA